ncbi:MAG: SDR family NAD(P)-dependent oxidoreductase, partial [Nitrososphaerales archaeon]
MSVNIMREKICLVTGANSGIGFVIAKELARMEATVVMVCRDKAKGIAARGEIETATGNHSLELIITDLSSLGSVRELAQEFRQKHSRLNVLVNNAGLIMGKRVMTPDGLETTFEVNYLSHFLLTHLLLDQLKAGAPSRIVNVSSDAHFNG